MEENQTKFRIGPIRPPSEANSLLLQITEGCTWNRCKFCGLYKHEPFRIFSVESVKRDIDVMAGYAKMALDSRNEDGSWDRRRAFQVFDTMDREEQYCYYLVYNWLSHGGENVFLQDGNSLALKSEKVIEILEYLRKTFPFIKRVTTYGRAETLSKISTEQFVALKKAGLDRIHSGYESGSDQVLELISKGTTAEQEIQAGKNIKAGGIELSVYFMAGVGGKGYSKENAEETARVINEVGPDFVRIRSAVIKEGTELWDDYLAGRYELCGEEDKIRELKVLVEQIHRESTMLVSDHMINLLPELQGNFVKDKEKMLHLIDAYLSLGLEERKLFELARRSGKMVHLTDLVSLEPEERNRLERIVSTIPDEKSWNEYMNHLMMGFI